jgi:hypothetical protein
MLGFKLFETAKRTIQGIKMMHMIKNGLIKLKKLSVSNNVQLIHRLFGFVTFMKGMMINHANSDSVPVKVAAL